MRIFGVSGYSGSGKTTLLVKVIPQLVGRGLRVSTIKQANPDFDIDKPGKDSYQHRSAGAREVLIVSARRWALMHEFDGPQDEVRMEDILPRMAPADLLLVEGFRTWPHSRIEVHRPDLGRPLMQPSDPHVVAVASDTRLEGLAVPLLDLDDAAGIADFIISHCRLETAR